MADATPVSNVEGSDEVQATNTPNNTVQTPQGSTGTYNGSLGSMGNLQAQYPEFYRALMQGMAWNCIKEQERYNRHFKEILRYGSRQS
jgi:hypothetical protein